MLSRLRHLSPCVYVSLGIARLYGGRVTYFQIGVSARALGCGDVEPETEFLTLASIQISIDEVRTTHLTFIP